VILSAYRLINRKKSPPPLANTKVIGFQKLTPPSRTLWRHYWPRSWALGISYWLLLESGSWVRRTLNQVQPSWPYGQNLC